MGRLRGREAIGAGAFEFEDSVSGSGTARFRMPGGVAFSWLAAAMP
jgi:hypothetical protein